MLSLRHFRMDFKVMMGCLLWKLSMHNLVVSSEKLQWTGTHSVHGRVPDFVSMQRPWHRNVLADRRRLVSSLWACLRKSKWSGRLLPARRTYVTNATPWNLMSPLMEKFKEDQEWRVYFCQKLIANNQDLTLSCSGCAAPGDDNYQQRYKCCNGILYPRKGKNEVADRLNNCCNDYAILGADFVCCQGGDDYQISYRRDEAGNELFNQCCGTTPYKAANQQCCNAAANALCWWESAKKTATRSSRMALKQLARLM